MASIEPRLFKRGNSPHRGGEDHQEMGGASIEPRLFKRGNCSEAGTVR
ncbi:MAG: hypothetical protein QOH25_1510 [Acidobacteriota bacterium]|nr:hypothetical protein [Acidobacteriota bacterium]